jgi:hypothetical protein
MKFHIGRCATHVRCLLSLTTVVLVISACGGKANSPSDSKADQNEASQKAENNWSLLTKAEQIITRDGDPLILDRIMFQIPGVFKITLRSRPTPENLGKKLSVADKDVEVIDSKVDISTVISHFASLPNEISTDDGSISKMRTDIVSLVDSAKPSFEETITIAEVKENVSSFGEKQFPGPSDGIKFLPTFARNDKGTVEISLTYSEGVGDGLQIKETGYYLPKSVYDSKVEKEKSSLTTTTDGPIK